MCVVSNMINDWSHPTWPDFPKNDPWVPTPNAIPWPKIESDPKLAAQMLEILQKLEAIDKRLGMLEQCKIAEPAKKEIKKRLRKIAKRTK